METAWQQVPERVRRLTEKHAGYVRRHVRESPNTDLTIYDEGILVPIHFAQDFSKHAEAPLRPLAAAYDWPGSLLGGPNPLTRTLTGAALGTAAGYGGGWLMEHLFPRKYLDRGRLRRNLAIMGGLLGGGAPAYLFARPQLAEHGWAGWTKNSADRGESALADPVEDAIMHAVGLTDEGQDKQGFLAHALTTLAADGTRFEPDALFLKAADSAGGAFLPRIPVDHWNQVMMRSPSIPDPVRAASAGLVNAASASHGGAKLVSPFDVGRIAMGMGSGAVSGMLVGKTIGALAGLTPEAQDLVFKTGVGAGILTNVLPMAFGN